MHMLAGGNLTDVTEVKFGGTATTFEVVSPTSIIATALTTETPWNKLH